MIHHQKSSKSSDQHIEVNLLKQRDRDSRIDMVRYQPRDSQNKNMLLRLKRGSEKLNRPNSLEDRLDEALNQNYSTYEPEKKEFSETILTNTADNSSFVGFILFGLLVVFTPLETLSLNLSQGTLQMTSATSVLEYLLACELASFTIIYYMGWIDRFAILKENLTIRDRVTRRRVVNWSHVLLLMSVGLLAAMWNVTYAQAIVQHQQRGYLMLFYIVVLPQVAGNLLFEDLVYASSGGKVAAVVFAAYILGCGLVLSMWAALTGLIGVVLICCAVRVGRVCVLAEYISKGLLLVGLMLSDLFGQPASAGESAAPLQAVLGCFALTVACLIAGRCVNNKVLRAELYKYFYMDTSIDMALLCLPAVVGLLENRTVDLLVDVVGCGFLLLCCYRIGRSKSEVNFEVRLE